MDLDLASNVICSMQIAHGIVEYCRKILSSYLRYTGRVCVCVMKCARVTGCTQTRADTHLSVSVEKQKARPLLSLVLIVR